MPQILLSNLLIYRNLLNDQIVYNYDILCQKYFKNNELESKEQYDNDYYNLCSMLIFSEFDSIGDYISYKILSDENIFSLKREKGQTVDEKVKRAVLHDITLFKKLFELPLKGLSASVGDTNDFIIEIS
ncbi:MAG: hypothetical protein WBJ13_11735 [Sedimentibacter sp.]